MMRAFEQRLPLWQFLQKHIFEYRVPANLNFWYAFGLLAIIFLVNQVLSGISLAMFYMPSAQEAFSSVWRIMQDVPSGWFIRYLHTSGASFLFLVLYGHIFRAFLYGSYRRPRELVWLLGVLLFLVLMLEAFIGYVLPWGQMSYWAAEVLSSAIKVIPWLGEGIFEWLRGGQELGTVLLQRFFVLHIVVLPLFLLYLIKFHIWAIRSVGSSQPTHDESTTKSIRFFPHHFVKELGFILLWVTLFFMVIFFFPQVNGLFLEKLNTIPANPSFTPLAIHPPWYIAAYFSILRSIPNLSLGICMTLLGLGLWFFLPILDKSQNRLLKDKPLKFQLFLVFFGLAYVLLTVLAFFELNVWNLWLSRFAVMVYYGFFLLMPWFSRDKGPT